jgi:hypothetical protein
MNGAEHAQAHAAEARRKTNETHSKTLEPTMDALARKHKVMDDAKSEARQRSLSEYRNPQGGER